MIIEKATLNGITYGIWHLTESVEELHTLIGNRFEVSLHGLNNPTRQKERLASRLLVEALCGTYCEVAYRSNGEPYLVGSHLHISISHTKNFVAVAVAPFRIGIDIEYTSDRVLRIQEKFLNPIELDFLAKATDRRASALLFWCAKEALYKKEAQKEPDFTLFTCQQNGLEASITHQETTYPLLYQTNKDFTLVMV
jgi:4'-phosphopantetheinyl transferase EntD